MRDRKRIIFIGPCGGGKSPSNGASYKNYYLIRYLQEKLGGIKVVDTEFWKQKPFLLFKLFFIILLNNGANYIVSANNKSAYRIFCFFSMLPFSKRKIIYWVIGGTIADRIYSGEYSAKPYYKIKFFLVEGQGMKQTLEKCGFCNVIVVPNFKDFEDSIVCKIIPRDYKNRDVRFVFLSRILPEKGTDLILEACEVLGEKNDFVVDFYGPIEDSYSQKFLSKIKNLSMVHYKGFLDLRDVKNYAVLSEYDVMLFPTFWNGEGFPGIIIDSCIAGLPVIASDWSMNREIIEDGKTGWIIPHKSLDALVKQMVYVINNSNELNQMRANCVLRAKNFSIENIITDDLLIKIGLKSC